MQLSQGGARRLALPWAIIFRPVGADAKDRRRAVVAGQAGAAIFRPLGVVEGEP